MNGPASDVLDAVWNWRSIREFHTASFFLCAFVPRELWGVHFRPVVTHARVVRWTLSVGCCSVDIVYRALFAGLRM